MCEKFQNQNKPFNASSLFDNLILNTTGGLLSTHALPESLSERSERKELGAHSVDTANKVAAFTFECGVSLPCLYSNNSIENENKENSESDYQAAIIETLHLSTAHKKSATALAWNIESLANEYGIERLGFLTLTFPDHVTDPREAQRRFNSFVTNFLGKRYPVRIRVYERTKSNRIHYHLIVVLNSDIRSGFDFKQAQKKIYKSASQALRDEWSFLRESAHKYGFGRTELLPIKSTAEGVSRYVGKYISKTIDNRQEEDKGFRLVEYSRAARTVSSKFSFNSHGSRLWRMKLKTFQLVVSHMKGYNVPFENFKKVLGAKWAYANRDFIFNLPILVQNDLSELLESFIDFSKRGEVAPLDYVISVLQSRSIPQQVFNDVYFSRYLNYKSEFKNQKPLIKGK